MPSPAGGPGEVRFQYPGEVRDVHGGLGVVESGVRDINRITGRYQSHIARRAGGRRARILREVTRGFDKLIGLSESSVSPGDPGDDATRRDGRRQVMATSAGLAGPL